MTRGLAPSTTGDYYKPVPTEDGSGRVQAQHTTGSSVIIEDGINGRELTPSSRRRVAYTPSSGYKSRESRPTGNYILFNQIQVGQGGYIGEFTAVGKLTRVGNTDVVEDVRVAVPSGEERTSHHLDKSARSTAHGLPQGDVTIN